MAAAIFDITLQDGTIETIAGADAYAQEGQMTTFFTTDQDRGVIDAWSTRLASIRTAEIRMIRRLVA